MARFSVTISEVHKSTWHVDAKDKDSAIQMAVTVRNNSLYKDKDYDKQYHRDLAEYYVKGEDFAGALIENGYKFTKRPCQIIIKVSDDSCTIIVNIPKLIKLYHEFYEVGGYEFFNEYDHNGLCIRFDT